jgi:ribosomal protein L40E
MAQDKICTQCGAVGSPKLITKGHIVMEIFLWCMFLVPGLIYSIWRHASRSYGCRSCGSADIIPVNTPRGKKLMEDFGQK